MNNFHLEAVKNDSICALSVHWSGHRYAPYSTPQSVWKIKPGLSVLTRNA